MINNFCGSLNLGWQSRLAITAGFPLTMGEVRTHHEPKPIQSDDYCPGTKTLGELRGIRGAASESDYRGIASNYREITANPHFSFPMRITWKRPLPGHQLGKAEFAGIRKATVHFIGGQVPPGDYSLRTPGGGLKRFRRGLAFTQGLGSHLRLRLELGLSPGSP